MPRFFFHAFDGAYLPDTVGRCLPDLAAARREAIRFAGRLLLDDHVTFWANDSWRVEVTTADGAIVLTLLFASATSPRWWRTRPRRPSRCRHDTPGPGPSGLTNPLRLLY